LCDTDLNLACCSSARESFSSNYSCGQGGVLTTVLNAMLVSNENPFVLWLNREDVSGGQRVSEPVSKDEFTISSVAWFGWSADSLPGGHTLASSC
jgi:predicted outer membrane repeat protein